MSPRGPEDPGIGRAREEDERSRAVARTEFVRPLVLDAGAGTGKTAVVAVRIIAWLLGEGWERAAAAIGVPSGVDDPRIAERAVERVVAITFTDRAAAEMAARIARLLASVHRGEDAPGLPLADLPGPDASRRARAAALLAAQDRLAVSTIHAYCRRLLAAFPLAAGWHPEFEVDAEGTRLAATVEEVMAERLPGALGEKGDADWVELAARGHGPAAIAEALTALAAEAVPPEALEEDPLSDERARFVAEELASGAAQIAALVREPFATPAARRLKTGPALAAALERAAEAAAHVSGADALLRLAREGFEATELEHLAKWSGLDRSLSDGELALLAGIAPDLRPAAAALHGLLTSLRRVDPEILGPARRVLRALLDEVSRRMRRRGIATFGALVRDAAGLLAIDEVARAVRCGIDQLVVDEFQDTDTLQCEIVRRLALEGKPSERPGLMLVGDPKQSIYGWRDASLAAYRAFTREVLEKGGECLPLVVNFRSVPSILDEVTRIARPLLVEDGDRQAPFQELVPHRAPGAPAGRAAVEYWVSWSADRLEANETTSAEEAREVEAHAVAAEIDALRSERRELGKMAILLRASSSLDRYLEALRARDIPFVVEREREYFRRREVIDAAALVRTIADPLDTLALVTFLRSPWGGVPDAALPGLWQRGVLDEMTRLAAPDAGAFARLDAAVDAVAARIGSAGIPGLERMDAWPHAAKAAFRAIVALRRALVETPADAFVESLSRELLAAEFAAARYLGAHRLANVERFLGRLLSGLAGPEGLQGVLRDLRGGVAERREEREGSPGDESLDAVRVLTIHKAKGLDFDHVFVVDLHHEVGRGESRRHRAVRRPDGSWNLQLLGVPGLGYHSVLQEENAIAEAEAVRTLYVAATRARERMVLAGVWPDPRMSGRGPRRSHLALLSRREGGIHASRLSRAGDGFADASGVLWRVPEARDEDALRAAGGERREESIDDAVRDRARIAEALSEARARAAMPATATPSGAAHAEERARREALDDPETGSPETIDGKARRDLRLAAGTAIHRVLETWDLDADPDREQARQRARIGDLLPSDLPPALREEARSEAASLLDRIAARGMLARFAALRGRLIGREVPLLRAPASAAPGEPVGAWVGTIDLLYRAADGAIVVADYKTDELHGDEAIEARARSYAPQLLAYLETVRATIAEPGRPAPRAEIWFLAAGKIALL